MRAPFTTLVSSSRPKRSSTKLPSRSTAKANIAWLRRGPIVRPSRKALRRPSGIGSSMRATILATCCQSTAAAPKRRRSSASRVAGSDRSMPDGVALERVARAGARLARVAEDGHEHHGQGQGGDEREGDLEAGAHGWGPLDAAPEPVWPGNSAIRPLPIDQGAAPLKGLPGSVFCR